MTVVVEPRAGAAFVPGITRTELPYGLFSVASMRGDADGRWALGATWDALPCDPAGTLDDPCLVEGAEPLGADFDADRECSVGAAAPFTVYGYSTGSPVGNGDHEQRALDHLAARAEAAVEAALWSGQASPSFGDDAEEPAGATSVGITAGIAALEAYIAATYGSLGVLHMPRDVATLALADGVLTSKGNRLTTKLGTPVAAGAGYTSGDGTSFVYATPALMVYNTAPALLTGAEAVFATPTNDVAAIAASTYLVGWDPCGVARVTVDPSQTD